MSEDPNDFFSRIQHIGPPIPKSLLKVISIEETEEEEEEEFPYWKDKAINIPKQKRDFQTTRINQNHEKSMGANPISQKQYGDDRIPNSKHKGFADPFPHQCRYFTGECTAIVLRSAENRSHFDKCHPSTVAESNLYNLAHSREPGGKTAYLLALCFGRSEDTVREMISGDITKWGRRSKEIEHMHRTFKQNIGTISGHYKMLAELENENNENDVPDTSHHLVPVPEAIQDVEDPLYPQDEISQPINLNLPENLIPKNMVNIQQQFTLIQALETTTEPSIINMQQTVNMFVEQYNELSKKLEVAENREKDLQHIVDVLRKYIDDKDNLIRSFYEQHINTDLNIIWDKDLE